MNAPKDPHSEHRPPPLRSAKPRLDAAPAAGSKPSPLPLVVLGAALGTVAVVVLLGGYVLGRWLWWSSKRDLSQNAPPSEIHTPLPGPVTPPAEPKPQVAKPTPEPVYDPTELLPEDLRKPPIAKPAVEPLDDPRQLLPEDIRKEAEKEPPKEELPARDPVPAVPPATIEPGAPPPPPPSVVFKDVLQRQNRLELPPLHLATASVFERHKLNTTPQVLARLYVDDVKQCQLALEGREFAAGGSAQHRLELQDGDGTRTWNLMSQVEAGAAAASSAWGVFELKDQTLSFQWKTMPPLRLQLCTLAITVGNQTQRCRLTRVEQAPPRQIDFQKMPQSLALKSLEQLWRAGDDVRVECFFRIGAGNIFRADRRLAIGDKTVIQMHNPHVATGMGDDTVEIEASLQQVSSSQPPQLSLAAFVYPEPVTSWATVQAAPAPGTPATGYAAPYGSTQPTPYAQPAPGTPAAGYSAPYGSARTIERTRQAWTAEATQEWQTTLQTTAGKAAEASLRNVPASQKAKWSRLAPEVRQKAIAYQELKNQAMALSQNPSGRAALVRLTEKMRSEFTPQIDKLATECGLNIPQRLVQMKQYEQATAFVNVKLAWCAAMEKFQKELYDSGRLHYRVYLEGPEGVVDLEVMEGFGSN